MLVIQLTLIFSLEKRSLLGFTWLLQITELLQLGAPDVTKTFEKPVAVVRKFLPKESLDQKIDRLMFEHVKRHQIIDV